MNVLENETYFLYKKIRKDEKINAKINECFLKNEKLYVSLSGGVDSMVIVSVLHYNGYDVTALHINYNNRYESIYEQKFLEKWCKTYNIELKIKDMKVKRNEISRNEYEKYTNKQRFDFYKENCDRIILGHHKNDIVENVFSNIMKSKNLFELNSMNYEGIVNDIIVTRPLIFFYKKDIYNFAHEYGIPYFKDTTPKWSNRGKLRNDIFPIIENMYPQFPIAYNKLACESYEWKKIIEKLIVENITKTIKYRGNLRNVFIIIPIQKLKMYKYLSLWKLIFIHSVHDMGLQMFSNKSIQELYDVIIVHGNDKFKKKMIGKDIFACCNVNNLIITYNIKT